MNFKIYTNTKFYADIDIYSRTYYVLKKSNGKIKISNVLNGSILLDNLDTADILINGQPMSTIDDLQSIVYNKNCNCDVDNIPEEKKIFDKTFDKTFQ